MVECYSLPTDHSVGLGTDHKKSDGGVWGIFTSQAFFSRSLLRHDFFRVKPSVRFFLADKHYFLDFVIMFNNKHAYGMQ